MKKLPALTLERLLVLCGFSLAMTMAGFWHYQQNVIRLEGLNVLQQGVSTCFTRVTQTFTASMIKDLKSPYLNRDFMGLSDECLNETMKTVKSQGLTSATANKAINDLTSEVYWFHEKVMKVVAPAVAGKQEVVPLTSVSQKYSKIETLKLEVVDAIDAMAYRLKQSRLRDEAIVGLAFFAFLAAVFALGMKEMKQLRIRRKIESDALALLNTGKNQIGAMVDDLVIRSLQSQGMNVTSQVFSEYHGNVMEKLGYQNIYAPRTEAVAVDEAPVVAETEINFVTPQQFVSEQTELKTNAPAVTASAEEVIGINVVETVEAILRNSQREGVEFHTDLEEAKINCDGEVIAQLVQATIARYCTQQDGKLNIALIGSSEDSIYKTVVRAPGFFFNADELNYMSGVGSAQGIDMNLVMVHELAQEGKIVVDIRNQTNEKGRPVGAEVEFHLPLSRGSKTLVAVVKGKKKDLIRRQSELSIN